MEQKRWQQPATPIAALGSPHCHAYVGTYRFLGLVISLPQHVSVELDDETLHLLDAVAQEHCRCLPTNNVFLQAKQHVSDTDTPYTQAQVQVQAQNTKHATARRTGI